MKNHDSNLNVSSPLKPSPIPGHLVLKQIPNRELIAKLKLLVSEERKILTEILLHLQEVERRDLHLDEGYSPLFDYAVKNLGYTGSQAYRRIAAMRLMTEIPELKASLDSGELNLTQLTQAREYFKHEAKNARPVPTDQKVELLHFLANKSTRETEKVFATLSPETAVRDKTRVITETLIELKFVVSETVLEKLQRFRDLDSHVFANPNYAETLERLLDLALQSRETKNQTRKPKSSHSTGEAHFSAPKKNATKKKDDTVGKEPLNPLKPSRYIPVKIRRHIMKINQGKCSYQNPETGHVCGSTYRVQVDHRVPFAKNGATTTENLRTLCQAHNLFMAEKEYGKEKMSAFRKSNTH